MPRRVTMRRRSRAPLLFIFLLGLPGFTSAQSAASGSSSAAVVNPPAQNPTPTPQTPPAPAAAPTGDTSPAGPAGQSGTEAGAQGPDASESGVFVFRKE